VVSFDLPSFSTPLHCPSCDQQLDHVVINPAGELLGCVGCAEGLGIEGEALTLEEWNAAEIVHDVLSRYALAAPQPGKPSPCDGQRPRLHYWEVVAGNRRYYLKRFQDWYPTGSIRYVHSILAHLAEQGLAAPRVVAGADGADCVEVGGSRWALYCALDGRTATERDWMWGRPKAAEMLATLHAALDGFTPEGESFDPWNAWTLDTVDRVLESWEPHPDLSPGLLGFVRERLAARYFGELYPELPKLVVHGDYVLSNVLWKGDPSSASISGVLDFERAHRDTALYDFAWGLGDRRPPLLRATVAAYCRERALAPVEREALPEAMLLGSLMAIDMQLMYFRNAQEVTRQAQDLALLVRDLEALRKAVAPKTSAPVAAKPAAVYSRRV
jgi:Ser/Thr protein kinase RdoA (MazF antagonist)